MAVEALTLAGNDQWGMSGGLEETLEGGCWVGTVQSLFSEFMMDEAKQGDSDAHDACCRISRFSAAMETESLVSKGRCKRTRGGGVCWRSTKSRIWASSEDSRSVVYAAIFCALYLGLSKQHQM